MADPTGRERALEETRQLPESASWEDVMEQIPFMEQVERGLAGASAGWVIPHEQVKVRFGR